MRATAVATSISEFKKSPHSPYLAACYNSTGNGFTFGHPDGSDSSHELCDREGSHGGLEQPQGDAVSPPVRPVVASARPSEGGVFLPGQRLARETDGTPRVLRPERERGHRTRLGGRGRCGRLGAVEGDALALDCNRLPE